MILSLSLAAGYILLFFVAIVRRRRSTTARWLAALLAATALLSAVFALNSLPEPPAPRWQPGLLQVALYLLTISLLGAVLFGYLSQSPSWAWLVVGGAAILAVTAGAQFEPAPGLLGQSWRGALLNPWPSFVALMAVFFWLLASLTQIVFSLIALRQARLPLHANRILYWVLWLPVFILGGTGAAWGAEQLSAVGQVVQFVGLAGLTYAVLTHRLIDIRNSSRRAMGQIVLILLTALTALLAIELADLLLMGIPIPERLAAIAALALIVGLVHQPVRALAEQVVTQMVIRAAYDPAAITREFSEQIASLLDMPQLARAAGETFRAVFGAGRTVLLLLTPQKDGQVKAVPIAGLGPAPSLPIRFSADNPLLGMLSAKRQPVLQYDLDTDPAYRGMAETQSAWLQALHMDVYLPVRDSAALSAVFGVGPKESGDPYRPEELNILAALADQTSVALKNSRLFTDLKQLNEEMSALNRDLRQSNETLARMDQVKTDFITIASHELRTPLTQLRGYADVLGTLIRQNMLNPEMAREVVDSIKRASDRLDAVYGQMLDASQLDVNALDLKLTDTTLEAILRLAVEPYAKPMRDRKQTLTAQGVRGLPTLRGDFQRLVQAFGQVIGNAVKFTPDGGRIDIAARLLTPDAGQSPSVEVVIADTGIGIDPKFHALIFDKFFRIGSTALHSTGGTKFMGAGPGLGLPIARGIIQRHGGRIWVESPGQDLKKFPGSKFHVVLPLSPPAFTPEQAAALIGAGDGKGKRGA